MTIIVLALIMIFLLKEGAGFLGTYKHELEIYRRAGLEFCDIVDRPLSEQQELSSKLRRAVTTSVDPIIQASRTRRDAAFLLKREVEDQTKLQREPLEAALEKTPVPAAAELDPLRQQLAAAMTKAAAAMKVPDTFTADEAKRLRGEFAKLTPEVSDLPPMLLELSAAFTAKDKEAKQKFGPLVDASDELEEAPEDLRAMLGELKEEVLVIKEAATTHFTLEEGRQKLLSAASKARILRRRRIC